MLQNGLLAASMEKQPAIFEVLQEQVLAIAFRNPSEELKKYLYVRVKPESSLELVALSSSRDNRDKNSVTYNLTKHLLDVLQRTNIEEGYVSQIAAQDCELAALLRLRYSEPPTRMRALALAMNSGGQGRFVVRCAFTPEEAQVHTMAMFRVDLGVLKAAP